MFFEYFDQPYIVSIFQNQLYQLFKKHQATVIFQ